MKSYNGFSANERTKSGYWLNNLWRNGLLERPSKCCACGQTKGRIDAHAEDYSEPFQRGKTDKYPLCFRCHMMVHCRFRNKEAWEEYRTKIASGVTYPPVPGNNFKLFCAQMFDKTAPLSPEKVDAPRHDVLGDIEQESIEISTKKRLEGSYKA